MQLNRLPARVKASGTRATSPARGVSPLPAADTDVKRDCGDGEFGSNTVLGILSLATSSLIVGTFNAFAEGFALYAASMAGELPHRIQDSEPPVDDGHHSRDPAQRPVASHLRLVDMNSGPLPSAPLDYNRNSKGVR